MFYRTIRMLEHGIKPLYVFDGKPPQLKSAEVRVQPVTVEAITIIAAQSLLCSDVHFFMHFLVCVTHLTMLIFSSFHLQLEKRGERRAEAEKLLAQAQEIGTLLFF